MKIKKNITSFSIRNDQGFQINNLKVPCEVEFPERSIKQQVYFSIGDVEIYLDLIHYKREELREFKLMESNLISKDYLNKMSIEFSFNIANHPLASDLSIGVIPSLSIEFGKTCYGAIKKVQDQFFFTIFSKRGNTSFEDNIIYLYGIWEVNLPEKIESRLFNLYS